MNLTQIYIDVVRAALKGAKLAKFDASIEVIKESLAQGAWITRGKTKAQSGFYQGLCKPRLDINKRYRGTKTKKEEQAAKEAWDLHMTLSYGHPFGGDLDVAISALRKETEEDSPLKVSDGAIRAWVALCAEVAAVHVELDEARPLPVITKIGLSPKVTRTLTEMNLDIDLQSITMAKLEAAMVPALDSKTFKPILDNDGKPKLKKVWRVVWTPGIVHGTSRFASGGHCEACGKRIPSGRFVPVEANDKRSEKLISLWLGCDCAKNIFGIQDIGIEKE